MFKTLLLSAVVLGALSILAWLRERRLGARTRALREVLDLADELEGELQECRQRLREIPALVSRLPPSLDVSVRATLAAEPEVQAALHDLLQHRLWLKQNGEAAALEDLNKAKAALQHSRERLSEQLQRLGEAREELANAGKDVEDSLP